MVDALNSWLGCRQYSELEVEAARGVDFDTACLPRRKLADTTPLFLYIQIYKKRRRTLEVIIRKQFTPASTDAVNNVLRL